MATQSNSTQTIVQRGGFLPVIRYGNFAGQGYAGRLGTETVIEHPSINGGKPILTSELTRTPQGLASFMKLAVQTEPNGYLDGVTRNHDIEYTVGGVLESKERGETVLHAVNTRQFDGQAGHSRVLALTRHFEKRYQISSCLRANGGRCRPISLQSSNDGQWSQAA